MRPSTTSKRIALSKKRRIIFGSPGEGAEILENPGGLAILDFVAIGELLTDIDLASLPGCSAPPKHDDHIAMARVLCSNCAYSVHEIPRQGPGILRLPDDNPASGEEFCWVTNDR